ncbi:MAG: tRNA (N(6)-L-threonylcarbamoyladenosine(37)-C(2))-methylthiotransferase MtaB [Pseudomonadota bacterium]
MQVHFETLGCRLNEAELEMWAGEFCRQGHSVAQEIEHADLVVVNTCAVTAEAVRKSRRLVRRAQRTNPQARLVVSGCYASLNKAESNALPGVDLLVDNRDKERLPQLVAEAFSVPVMPQIATEPGENTLFRRGRQRAFIKVQDGCRYRCTYCIVTEARGEERSRPLAEIIDEINALHAQGIQEAVITGVHLGGYGSGLGVDLSDLIEAILAQTKIPRLRLGSLEPWDIPAGFWRLFENDRLMPHLHLPLQSGADAVLRRMARRCKTADFQLLVMDAHKQVPGLNITTDIIVGFPGESDAEWRQTIKFLSRLQFSHIHIFSYSSRPGTKAATLPDKVDEQTRRRRSSELHTLMSEMKNSALEAALNQTVEVLVESKATDGDGDWYVGYTPNYLRIRFPVPETDQSLENRIVSVAITGIDQQKGALTGDLVHS